MATWLQIDFFSSCINALVNILIQEGNNSSGPPCIRNTWNQMKFVYIFRCLFMLCYRCKLATKKEKRQQSYNMLLHPDKCSLCSDSKPRGKFSHGTLNLTTIFIHTLAHICTRATPNTHKFGIESCQPPTMF